MVFKTRWFLICLWGWREGSVSLGKLQSDSGAAAACSPGSRAGSELSSPELPHQEPLRDFALWYLSCLFLLSLPHGRGTSLLQGVRSGCMQSTGQDLLCRAQTCLLLFYFGFSFYSWVNQFYCLQKKYWFNWKKCRHLAKWIIFAEEMMGGGCVGQNKRSGGCMQETWPQLWLLYLPCLLQR